MASDNEIESSSEDINDENVEFIVEKIVDRRICRGQLEYLVKWQNVSAEENSWELAINLDCDILKSDYEERRSALKNNKRKFELIENDVYVAKAKRLRIEASVVIDNVFECGYEADIILGAKISLGHIFFLIKFKDVDRPEVVPSQLAYAQIPQMVIQFYEEQIEFQSEFATGLY